MGGLLRWYTGIGSRSTPSDVCVTFTRLAGWLERHGWGLRSGGAAGADESFERGVLDRVRMRIYLPEPVFRGRRADARGPYVTAPDHLVDRAREIVSSVHPNWRAVEALAARGRGFALDAHTRNVFQVLGDDLESPSDALVCWAPPSPDGSVTGGTASAVAIARARQIPIFNVAAETSPVALREFFRLSP